MYSQLISAAQTRGALESTPPPVVVDCRFDLARPDAGRAAYREGHIPGAVYAHLDEDLSGPKTSASGRHPLPEPTNLARKLGQWGIGPDTQVVAYDADSGAFAARLWWLLHWLGHDAVAVLDGGFKHWREAGLPISTTTPAPAHKSFRGQPRADLIAEAQEVAHRAGDDDWRVLDARAPERYAGITEPIDPVAGHIPGARNYPLTRNLDPNGRFLSPTELRTRFAEVLGDTSGGQIIAMCGSGVTACHNLLALEVAGVHGARLYPGSWSEWLRDPSRPIATGPKPR